MGGVRENVIRVNEGIRVCEVQSCLLCNGTGVVLYQNLRDALFGVPGTWCLLRCPKCLLVWLNPRPITADIPALYEHYATHELVYSRFTCLQKLVRNTVLAARLGYPDVARNPLEKVLGEILAWFGSIREMVELSVMSIEGPPRGRLLDVGCGNGKFLGRMRELGWDVVGVEPDGQAVNVARERFGLTVYETTLEETRLPDDAFDAITMSHVIEHLSDPIGTLRECCRLLKPGGRLVVVTPNVESLGHRLFREAWRGHDLPRHLYLFSLRSLLACAKAAALRVLELRTATRTARLIWAVSRLIRQNGVLPGGLRHRRRGWLSLEGFAFQAVEHALCKVTNVGEELVLIATK